MLKAFVLEDNAWIRQSLVEALAELAGVETVGVASTEHEAIAWLQNPQHAWDVAIIDLVLENGEGSGMGVVRAVRARAKHQKVVVLTGAASPAVRRQCEALGSDVVFDKSMEAEALLDYFQQLARQGSAQPT